MIAPRRCVGCLRYGDWLCSECNQSIVAIKNQRCYLCNRLSPAGRTCEICRHRSHLTGLVVSCHFEGAVRELVHRYKYDGNRELVAILERLVCSSVPDLAGKDWCVAWVPTHRTRVMVRGFDHAMLLANRVAVAIGKPTTSILKKTRLTPPQVGKRRADRLAGMAGTIAAVGPSCERIILVDDVATTGATLEECARVLRQAGAKRVYGIVVARGV